MAGPTHGMQKACGAGRSELHTVAFILLSFVLYTFSPPSQNDAS